MSSFNADLDKEIDSKRITNDTLGDLEISIRAYNNGDPKLQIGPRWKDEKPIKSGRLSLEEIPELIVALQELADKHC